MQKTIHLVLFLAFTFSCGALAQLQVYYNISKFYDIDQKPYVETSLLIPGNLIRYVENEKGNYSGALEVTLLFKQEDEIKGFEKYILSSAELQDTSERFYNIIDLKRNQLLPGKYLLEATCSDINRPGSVNIGKFLFTLEAYPGKTSFSDISIIDKVQPSEESSVYMKNGIEMFPYVFNYFPANVASLSFYTELYHTSENLNTDALLIRYWVEDLEGKKVPQLGGFKKVKSAAIIPFFKSFLIDQLPSGNYYLKTEARSKENDLLAEQKFFFQRNNPSLVNNLTSDSQFVLSSFVQAFSHEEMDYHLRTIFPLADRVEQQTIESLLKGDDHLARKRYFLAFWLNENTLDPEKAWLAYSKKLKYVNYKFGNTIEQGFETDRGRTFLKYGEPDNSVAHNEAGDKEYEIWHYYTTIGQQNVKFVFFNPTLVPNQHELIHSTARGEISDPEWQQRIYNSIIGPDQFDVDNPNVEGRYGEKLKRAYDGF